MTCPPNFSTTKAFVTNILQSKLDRNVPAPQLHLPFNFFNNMPDDNASEIPRYLAPIGARNRGLVAEPAQPPRDTSRTTELERKYRRQRDTIRSLQHELTNMGRELQEYKYLSNIRGGELNGARFYLTQVDRLSISDVKDKVNALDGEIPQASVSLGGALI